MLKKIIIFLTSIIVLTPYVSTVKAVYADDLQTSVCVGNNADLTGDYLQDNLITDKSTNVSIEPLMIGTATITAFLAANPALSLGVLLLGLACVSVGLKFGGLQAVYDQGLKVKSYLKKAEFDACFTGVSLIVSQAVRDAIIKSCNNGQLAPTKADVSADIPFTLGNDYVYNYHSVSYDDSYCKLYIDGNWLSKIKLVCDYKNGREVPELYPDADRQQVTMYTTWMEIEFWHSDRVFDDVGKVKVSHDILGDHLVIDKTVTDRGGIKYRLTNDGDWYGYEGPIYDVEYKADDYSNLYNTNITLTLPDYIGTWIGDTPLNGRDFAVDNPGLDKVYPAGTVITANGSYPISGGITAGDLPGILTKPDGYTDDDYAAIGNIVATGEDATDIDTEPDNPDDGDTDDSSTDLLDWLRRIFKLLTKFLSPTSSNVIKVLNNTVAIYDLIGQKASESKLHIVGLFGSAMSAISDVGDMVLDIPDKVADLTAGLWTDAGEVWTGIKDDVVKLGTSISSGFDTVMDGIEQGVKTFGDSLTDLKADTAAKVDAVGAKVDGIATTATDAATSVTDWLSEWLVPDFAGIKASFGDCLDRLKSKFGPVIDLSDSFKNIFSVKKSIYDVELDIFDQKLRPVPISLKPAIDVFKIFADGICVLLTLLRVYRRLTGGDGDLIAT